MRLKPYYKNFSKNFLTNKITYVIIIIVKEREVVFMIVLDIIIAMAGMLYLGFFLFLLGRFFMFIFQDIKNKKDIDKLK